MGSFGLPELLAWLGLLAISTMMFMVFRNIKKGGTVGFAVMGAAVGTVLGFLFRPSVPFVGQLPLDVVLTKGASLNGVDMILRSTAEQSFNYLIIGAILGAVVMAGAKGMMSQKPSQSIAATPASAPSAAMPSLISTFCTKCGVGLGQDVVFCGSCGARRG